MKTEPITQKCPKCGAPVPEGSAQGLCTKCLLAAAAAPTELGTPGVRRAEVPPVEQIIAAFPQFQDIELIGAGGMGTVYKARQVKLERWVALKVLPASLAKDPAFTTRFHREARMLGRLNHPNIVAVFDFGQSEEFFYLLMEYVDGVNLRQAMQAGRFTPQQALVIVPKICEALQYAHEEGILHRDIKPENILLDARGRVKIADFGIAKLLGERGDPTLTASGAAVGTPHYMAPEQIEHPQDVDQRADIYSLGVVFYEMLTGELPLGRFAPPSQKSPVSAQVDEVVLRTLEKERERRYQSATEVKTHVETLAGGGQGSPGRMPESRVPERRMRCHVSTPDHLRTFTGRFLFIYVGTGELRVGQEGIVYASGRDSVRIPLQQIQELRVGHYPRWAKPMKLQYLAVTFGVPGRERTLLFTPSPSNLSLPPKANHLVSELLQTVREACIARLGSAPRTVEEGVDVTNSFGGDLQSSLRQAILPVAIGAVLAGVMAVVFRETLMRHQAQRGGSGAEWIMVAAAVGFGISLVLSSLMKLRRHREIFGAGRAEGGAVGPGGTWVVPGTGKPEEERCQPTGSSSSTSPMQRSACYYATPTRMRDCFPGPAAHIFSCKGELLLEADQVVFVSPWQTRTVIPLPEIDALSIGQFQMWTTPWVMKYERLNFIAITFPKNGSLQTVYLTPVTEGATRPAEVTGSVSQWFQKIRDAATAQTGREPRAVSPRALTVSAEPAWNAKGLPLFFAGAAAMLGMGLMPSELVKNISVFLVVVLGVAWGMTGWFCVGFMLANKAIKDGNLEAVTSDEPPSDEGADGAIAHGLPGWWKPIGVLFLCLGLISLVEVVARLYEKPMGIAINPGVAWLFAGWAMLSLKRVWRRVANVALWCGLGILVAIGVLSFLDSSLSRISIGGFHTLPHEHPTVFATVLMGFCALFVWPLRILSSAAGRSHFQVSERSDLR